MGVIHEYGRSVIVRLRYRVEDDGGMTCHLFVDSDMPDRDSLLGILLRAQNYVMSGGDTQHEKEIDLSSLEGKLSDIVIEAEDE